MFKGMDALPFEPLVTQDLSGPPIRFKTDDRRVGRFDSLWMPFSSLLPDQGMKLALGLGIGNTFSTFGDGARYLFVRDDLGGGMTTMTLLHLGNRHFRHAVLSSRRSSLIGMDSLRLSVTQGSWARLEPLGSG